MYTDFFGLNEKPFSITPDPRYLFMSERHGEALAHLVYGVTESGGFIQLTGEVGTGKTMLVRTLLLNRMPDNADVAVVLNPQLSVIEFLATICEELHIDVSHNRGSIKAQTDALNRHLLEAHADGRRTILVVDEAQNLSPAVLEQVRLLTNLETAKQKLLQIILIGQPELRELLARTDLRQLAQRITGRYHLEPLSREETAHYIEHRLKVAGALGEVFDSSAKNEVFRLSQGVPRLINVVCDRALLGAYSQESRRVNKRLIRRAAAEVRGELDRSPWVRPIATLAGAVGVAIIAASVWWLARQPDLLPETPVEIAAADTIVDVSPESQPDEQEQVDTIEKAPMASEAETVVVDTEVVPSLNEQLLLAADVTTTAYALAALFDTWGLEFRTGAQSGCSQASAAGLACLYQRGSWSGLRQMDRPAILSLVDNNGHSHEVVLTAIHGEAAELSIGGVTVKHPVTEITQSWFGQYMLLWRPPGGAAVSLGPGTRGPAVLWLRESLATISAAYATQAAGSDLFDDELESMVRNFQRDHRLDGRTRRAADADHHQFVARCGGHTAPHHATTGAGLSDVFHTRCVKEVGNGKAAAGVGRVRDNPGRQRQPRVTEVAMGAGFLACHQPGSAVGVCPAPGRATRRCRCAVRGRQRTSRCAKLRRTAGSRTQQRTTEPACSRECRSRGQCHNDANDTASGGNATGWIDNEHCDTADVPRGSCQRKYRFAGSASRHPRLQRRPGRSLRVHQHVETA